VYQAGTMSGNPIVMAAGIATLNKLKKNKDEYYEKIDNLGKMLEEGLKEISNEKGIPLTINRYGGMFTIFFTDLKDVKTYEDVKTCNSEIFIKYFKHMILNGINIPPSQYEALFLSTVHTEEHINKCLNVFRNFNIE
ncbi:aminotransferase class III-fold pyridoxal phosphate-dependent enzyme, partial [Clostridium perfringens]|uniref:aminotransferase class III-fold pyridoxal phosphate-dependent enzyme n=1 Tax=Clostridium perfringens TaxID=1502 RepID=UPI002AC52F90